MIKDHEKTFCESEKLFLSIQKSSEDDKIEDENERNDDESLTLPIILKLISQNHKTLQIPNEIQIIHKSFDIKRSKYFNPVNALLINDPQISINHTEILTTDYYFLLGDRGSETGTFLIKFL